MHSARLCPAFFYGSLVVVSLAVWFAGSAVAAPRPLAAKVTIPPLAAPLPVGPSGLPDAAIAAMLDKLAPGTSQLIAIKPAGGGQWFAPALPIEAVAGSEVVGRGASNGSPTADRSTSAVRRLADDEFGDWGCHVNVYPPTFVYPGAIQGVEDFVSCIGLGETDVTACLKDSATYGLHACASSGHAGNGSWTAWSGAYACQTQTRAWATYGTNLYYSTTGAGSLWAFASPFGSAFTC